MNISHPIGTPATPPIAPPIPHRTPDTGVAGSRRDASRNKSARLDKNKSGRPVTPRTGNTGNTGDANKRRARRARRTPPSLRRRFADRTVDENTPSVFWGGGAVPPCPYFWGHPPSRYLLADGPGDGEGEGASVPPPQIFTFALLGEEF